MPVTGQREKGLEDGRKGSSYSHTSGSYLLFGHLSCLFQGSPLSRCAEPQFPPAQYARPQCFRKRQFPEGVNATPLVRRQPN